MFRVGSGEYLLKVNFDLNIDDLYAFQLRAIKRSSMVKRSRVLSYLTVFLASLFFAALPAIGSDGFSFWNMHFFLLGVFPICALFIWLLDKWRTRRVILDTLKDEKPERGQLGWHKITLAEKEIVEATAVNETRRSWAGVDRIEQSKEYIFIYTDPHAAFVIPKRAFDSLGAAESFYQSALVRKEAAGLKAADVPTIGQWKDD